MEPSDLLVLYTDGVTEAENETGQSLDREQLLKWARETATDSPEGLGRALLERLESFQGRCRNDDETLVVLQRERASLLAPLGEIAVNHSVPPQDELEIEAAVDGICRISPTAYRQDFLSSRTTCAFEICSEDTLPM